MGYRDDGDTRYERSLALQRQLEQAEARLAERELQLSAMRRGATGSLPPPGLPALARRRAVLATARARLATLDEAALVLIGAVIEELAMEPERRDSLLAALHPIVDAISRAHAQR